VVVVDSGSPRRLDSSPYATRRSECEAAAAVVGRPLGRATAADLGRISDPLLARRASHVVSEVARVRAFADALSNADLPGAGRLMVESHRSLRDDFDVSTTELDRLVASLCALPGVLGARVTGAGFGGCVVALCRPDTQIRLPNRRWHVKAVGGAWVRTQVE
jgi:galactokinase